MSLAAAITRAASSQTFYTIRFLVDRDRVEDAYRAYAYFRWVDDLIDGGRPPGPLGSDIGRFTLRGHRERFLARQRWLLERCLQGQSAQVSDPHEAILVDLVAHAAPRGDGLETYLRQMMLVMEFDLQRRGRLISEAELSAYTRWLAIAVTEAMHYFIGHGAAAPRDEMRYLAVSGAHILHMLRDTLPDARVGYCNVPRELLEAHAIGPTDVATDAYRAWVEGRVRLAAADLEAGRAYFARVESWRHRLAGLAYIARFERLIETMRRDDYLVRARYDDARSLSVGLGMARNMLSSVVGPRSVPPRPSIAVPRKGRS